MIQYEAQTRRQTAHLPAEHPVLVTRALSVGMAGGAFWRGDEHPRHPWPASKEAEKATGLPLALEDVRVTEVWLTVGD